jgi:hypothetical protein
MTSHQSKTIPSNSNSGGDKALEEWIKDRYPTEGFNDYGFLGFDHLKKKLIVIRPNQSVEIRSTVNR